MKHIKLAIVGSRKIDDIDEVVILLEVEEFMLKYKKQIAEFVSGGATGVDREVEHLSHSFKIPIKIFPADWKTHGKSAGPIRNKQIVDYCTHVLAFPKGESRGTRNCIKQAKEAGKPVIVIEL